MIVAGGLARVLVGATVGLVLALPSAAGAHGDARDIRDAWMSTTDAQGSQGLGTRGIWAAQDIRFGPREAVPQRPCRPDDRPETDLQGRVPPSDVASGRAAQGYNCNLEVVGYLHTPGGSTLDSLGDCAYYGMGAYAGASQVLDVADGRLPLPTTTLATTAMTNAWESLRVNAKRELLVADSPSSTYLDIYDISGDCRYPRLLSSTDMAPAVGHEGWFSPDGMTYYMSTTGEDAPTVFPVDISDPVHPKLRGSWAFEAQTHGGSTTEDGTRSYICQQYAPPKDKLLIVDTSDVAANQSSPRPRLLAEVPLGDNQWCQAAYRVTYNGHPFLIQYGERSGAPDCSRAGDNWATFGYPRIFDLADEREPKLVSTALLESSLPQHCREVTGEGALNGLGYSVHHCSPDRLYDPTILACSWFFAGMRVLDIRDPYQPVEIGYFNPGVGAVVGAAARPVVRTERGEIWFAHENGFYVMRFEDGIWPFEGSARCPEFDDYYYAQYNPGSSCPTANFNGIGKPAPGDALAGADACLPTPLPIRSRGIGDIRLGQTRRRLLRMPVKPLRRTRRTFRYCVTQSRGRVTAVFSRRGKRGRVRLITSTAQSRASRAFPRRQRLGRGLYRAGPRSRRIFGTGRKKVRFVGIADRRLLSHRRVLKRYLRRVGL